MSESAVKSAVETVLNLPEDEQVVAVEILQSIIETRESDLRLSEDQVAEVRRRLADPDRKSIPHEEVMASVRQLLGK